MKPIMPVMSACQPGRMTKNKIKRITIDFLLILIYCKK